MATEMHEMFAFSYSRFIMCFMPNKKTRASDDLLARQCPVPVHYRIIEGLNGSNGLINKWKKPLIMF